jgi:Helicase conserved C-terminal domain
LSTGIENEEQLRKTNPRYESRRKAWSKLPFCPSCNNPTCLRRVTADHGPLAHICTSPSCPTNQGGFKPLPFYIVDEDIYAIAPSVLLGTVDKLALIGHSPRTIRRILGMFGAAPWMHAFSERLYIPTANDLKETFDATNYVALQPTYKFGTKVFHDPFPSLVIQDEAHLLDESLGTFAGIFETTLDAMLDSLAKTMPDIVAWMPGATGIKRRRAKVVAASATVSRPERQLQHLYERSIPSVQFPYPGPDLYESFYSSPLRPAEPERAAEVGNVETNSQQARVYIALLTNGRPHTTTTVGVLAEFHCAITSLTTRLESGRPQDSEEVRQELIDHLSPGPLRQFHREALEAIETTPSRIATLVDLHRIALTYVTNKKGGDQILAAEETESKKRHQSRGLRLEAFQKALISGAVEQGQIQAIVHAAQSRVPVNQPLPPLHAQLRSIVATSAISHGVDVDELNAMFFAGLPADISEYIQASSRVGRTHVGFCVLIPTPQRRRDRYVVEVFDSFHRFLERMVQPAAIDRWAARAIARSIPSIYQAFVCGVIPSTELISSADAEKRNVADMNWTSDIGRRYRRNPTGFLKQIKAFAYSAIGLRDGFKPLGEPFYRNLVDEIVTDLTRDLSDQNNASQELRQFFQSVDNSLRRPMTSLRDVDQMGTITGKVGGRAKVTEEALSQVMQFIQHGAVDSELTIDEDD